MEKQSIRMAYEIHLNVAHFYFRFSTKPTEKLEKMRIEKQQQQ